MEACTFSNVACVSSSERQCPPSEHARPTDSFSREEIFAHSATPNDIFFNYVEISIGFLMYSLYVVIICYNYLAK